LCDNNVSQFDRVEICKNHDCHFLAYQTPESPPAFQVAREYTTLDSGVEMENASPSAAVGKYVHTQINERCNISPRLIDHDIYPWSF
jgi:hypothetical protein